MNELLELEPNLTAVLSKQCVICCGPCEECGDNSELEPQKLYNFLCQQFDIDPHLRDELATHDFSISACENCSKSALHVLKLEEEVKLIKLDIQVQLQQMKNSIIQSNKKLLNDFGIVQNNNLLSPLEHSLRQNIILKDKVFNEYPVVKIKRANFPKYDVWLQAIQTAKRTPKYKRYSRKQKLIPIPNISEDIENTTPEEYLNNHENEKSSVGSRTRPSRSCSRLAKIKVESPVVISQESEFPEPEKTGDDFLKSEDDEYMPVEAEIDDEEYFPEPYEEPRRNVESTKRKRGRLSNSKSAKSPLKPKRKYTKRRKSDTETLLGDGVSRKRADKKWVEENGIVMIENVEVHCVEGGYRCGVCDYLVTIDDSNVEKMKWSRRKMRLHIYSIHLRYFECEVCQKQLSTRRELGHHIDYVHRNKFTPCEICGKPLKTKCYTYHIWSHKSEEEKLACIAAGEKPPRSYYTPKAVRETLRFYCEKCRRYFCSQVGLDRHLKNHDVIDAKKDAGHLCAECGKTFASSQSLINHKRFVHDISKQRKYACQYCPATYLTKGYLRLHIMSHTGEKPLTCEICGKGFVRSNHLKWHMITHGDERPYACKICNMTYRRPAHLRRHHNTVHLKKKYPTKPRKPKARPSEQTTEQILSTETTTAILNLSHPTNEPTNITIPSSNSAVVTTTTTSNNIITSIGNTHTIGGHQGSGTSVLLNYHPHPRPIVTTSNNGPNVVTTMDGIPLNYHVPAVPGQYDNQTFTSIVPSVVASIQNSMTNVTSDPNSFPFFNLHHHSMQ